MNNAVQPIVIIGGGLAGVSSAYSLAKRGLPVILLEAESSVGQGASFANGAMLTPSMPEPWNSPGVGRQLLRSLFDPTSALLLRGVAIPSLLLWGVAFLRNSTPEKYSQAIKANFHLARFSTELTARWRDELDLDFEFRDCGTIKVFRDESSMAKSLVVARSLEPFGLRFTQLDSHRTIQAEPSLAGARNRICGSIHYPNDAIGNAHLFVLELGRLATEYGVQIRIDSKVKKIVRKQGYVVGVQTGNEFIAASRIVVAAGSASPQLLGPLGLRLPVRPAKGYSVTFNYDGESGPERGVIDDAMHAAVVPIGSRIRIVGTAEFAGNDTTIREDRIDNLLSVCKNLFPNLANDIDTIAPISWAGLRPMSADGLPFIGMTKVPGLFLNTGHGHLGWTMAAGSAEVLASHIVGDSCAIDVKAYSPLRM